MVASIENRPAELPNPLPEPIRTGFQDALRTIDRSVGALVRDREAHARIQPGVVGAWKDLARIESIVGLAGTVASTPRGRRFLVVDDDDDIRFLVGKTLRRLEPEARIQSASRREEALALLQDVKDGDQLVVICDYDLGAGQLGTELLAEIATLYPLAKRVLYTASDPDRIEHSATLPDAVIPKEGSMAALRAYVLRATG